MKNVLVIIASLNEEHTIGAVIAGIKTELYGCHVLVMDGYSLDNTVDVSLSHGASVIQLDKLWGIAGAVEAGILEAFNGGYEYLVRIDADGQHPTSEIKEILGTVVSGRADFVIGSRFLGMSDYNPNGLRKMSISIINLLLKVLHRVEITDCTSGCHIYNKKVIEFFARDKNFEYSEIRAIWMAKKAGFKIKEEFINMAPRKSGASSFSVIVALGFMFKNILDLILSTPIRSKFKRKL